MLGGISCRRNAIRECNKCCAKIFRYASASVVKRGYVLPGIVVFQENISIEIESKTFREKGRRWDRGETRRRKGTIIASQRLSTA